MYRHGGPRRHGVLTREVLVKGSPEMLLPRLRDAPADYAGEHARLSAAGFRVLALAYKRLRARPATSAGRSATSSCRAVAAFPAFQAPEGNCVEEW